MDNEFYRCPVCGQKFTDEEWDERHSMGPEGEDVHADCCPECSSNEEEEKIL